MHMHIINSYKVIAELREKSEKYRLRHGAEQSELKFHHESIPCII